jgi:triosephosphate isomerase (TIM)
MRRPFVAGNWKMNLDLASAVALADGLAKEADDAGSVDMAVCPPSVYLEAVGKALAGSSIKLGAQNMYHEPKGAFTGEISAAMLKDLGCTYVILGHSERRHVLHESSEDVNLKVHAALEAGLVPIVCVGELITEREAEQTDAVIRRQFEGSLSGVSAQQMANVVIAYEPVWAIGTGKMATPQQAEDVHLGLRRLLVERYNGGVAESVRIQYGGSVKPDNAADLMSKPNIDGALVGGASLKVDSLMGIVAGAGG